MNKASLKSPAKRPLAATMQVTGKEKTPIAVKEATERASGSRTSVGKKAGQTLKVTQDKLIVVNPDEPKKRGKNKLNSRIHDIGRKKSNGESATSGQSHQEESKAQKLAKKKKPLQLMDPKAFQTYIFRVLKQVKPEIGISKKAMSLVGNIIAVLFHKLMSEARELVHFAKRQTLSSKEIETSIKLHFPGELQKLAVQSSRASLAKFTQA